jgi:hypothetical protein
MAGVFNLPWGNLIAVMRRLADSQRAPICCTALGDAKDDAGGPAWKPQAKRPFSG